jgi:hypothetical protein
MKTLITLIAIIFTLSSCAQQEKYDIASFTIPQAWKKEVVNGNLFISTVNNTDKSWCKIGFYKSITSKGTITQDFNNDWKSLVYDAMKANTEHPATVAGETDGWKKLTGESTFPFNGVVCFAYMTTYTGYGVTMSIVSLTNSKKHVASIQNIHSSLTLTKPQGNNQNNKTNNNTNNTPPNTKTGKFTFTTTNFDNGWVATEQADWVSVTKGTIKVLVHYPNKTADVYNSDLMDGLKNAWNVLVAPRYSSAKNFEFKPLHNWEPIEFAEADMVEKATGKTVHVVLFKKNYSNGSGRYVEFITPDKPSFEQEFGAYHEGSSGWEKIENMAFYNKFAVAPADLTGKWTNDFSGAISYVNVNTGLDAGTDTHASVENFYFQAGNKYKWDLSVASGPVGNIKFQTVNSSGTYSMTGNWIVNFSNIENKARSYEVYFSCIKGLRILWIDNRPFAKAE